MECMECYVSALYFYRKYTMKKTAYVLQFILKAVFYHFHCFNYSTMLCLSFKPFTVRNTSFI